MIDDDQEGDSEATKSNDQTSEPFKQETLNNNKPKWSIDDEDGHDEGEYQNFVDLNNPIKSVSDQNSTATINPLINEKELINFRDNVDDDAEEVDQGPQSSAENILPPQLKKGWYTLSAFIKVRILYGTRLTLTCPYRDNTHSLIIHHRCSISNFHQN